jgi:hypothetical protein
MLRLKNQQTTNQGPASGAFISRPSAALAPKKLASTPENISHQTVSSVHTQNSVERPQNRHLKHFKSRAELGGQLDPRINIGGRPKILLEESAKFLEKRDKNGVTNARKLIEQLHRIVMSKSKDAVAAFNALRQAAEPTEGRRRKPQTGISRGSSSPW